jgi:hypothetical protein
MRTRQCVNRALRRGFFGTIIGFAVMVGGVIASDSHPAFIVVVIIGFALAGASIVYLSFGGRCIHCQRPLSRLFAGSSSPFNISRDLRFCPYCGRSLDDDVAA